MSDVLKITKRIPLTGLSTAEMKKSKISMHKHRLREGKNEKNKIKSQIRSPFLAPLLLNHVHLIETVYKLVYIMQKKKINEITSLESGVLVFYGNIKRNMIEQKL